MQQNAEVDEPESTAAPVLPQRVVVVRDDRLTDTLIDALTEEALLKGLEILLPVAPSTGGGSSSEGQANQAEHHPATLKGATLKGK
jgi:hypothetical protein